MFLYKKYGPDFMTKFKINGMYAFVLYDNVKDIYVVARDPMGICPLYIGYGKDGSVWFSSELKALQEHCLGIIINFKSIIVITSCTTRVLFN